MECEKFVVIFVIFFKMATSNKQKLKESIIQYYKFDSEKGFCNGRTVICLGPQFTGYEIKTL